MWESALADTFLHGLYERAQEVFNGAAGAGLDFHRYDHAGREIDLLLFDPQGRSRHAHPGCIDQPGFLLWNGVIGHADDPAIDRPIEGEREGFDFDLYRLTRLHKADIPI